ncbi:solute carrier family 26 member 6-like isoform X2 [Paramacrobiotus metropolitanus]|nr:solute carrier family 26 member 6-like isoform X2 [Paramacrobiotus metropolitanus]
MIHFTQEFATAMTGSMRPTQGLYISIFPPLIYALLATSPHNSLGAMPITAAVVGVSVMGIQETYYPQQYDAATGTLLSNGAQWDLHFQVSTGLAFFAGCFMIAWGLLKMGFLFTIISPSVMDPFGLACMLQSIMAQVPAAFGIQVPVRFTYAKHFRDLIYFLTNIYSIKVWEVVISISFASVVLVFREYLQPIIYRKTKLVVPIEFLMFVVVIGLSYHFRFQQRLDVRVVGSYNHGLPWPSMPGYDYGLNIVWHGFFCAVIAYSVTLGSARTLARKNKDNIKTNQELIALGCAHLFGSFFSSFIVSAPMGRGIINQSMGSRSQLSALFGSVFLGIIVAFAGPAISYLPQCIISTTIVLFLVFSLRGFTELPKLWKSNKFDALVWVLTFVASVTLNVQIGFLLGITLSVVGLTIRTQSPKVRVLGRLKNSNGFVPLKYYNKAEEIAGIRILQINCPLHYANAHYLVQDVLTLAMEPFVIAKSSFTNESNLFNESGHSLRSFLGTTSNPKLYRSKNRFDNGDKTGSGTTERPRFTRKLSSSQPEEFPPYKPPTSTTRISNEFIMIAGSSTSKASRVILDLGTVGYIDAVGIRGLEQLASDLKVKAIELILAQCKGSVRKQLRELELGKIVPERNIFPSLVDAVNESSRRIRIKTIEAQGTIRDRERRDVRFWDFPVASRISGLPQINYRKD